jgi:uncharacterized protein YcfJ
MSNKILIGITATSVIIATAAVAINKIHSTDKNQQIANSNPQTQNNGLQPQTFGNNNQDGSSQYQQQVNGQSNNQQQASATPVRMAHVLQVLPKYTTSTSRQPIQVCHEVSRTEMITRNKKDGTTGGVIGGVTGATAGAVIGNNVAQAQNGSVVGGVIGGVVGALAGNQIEKHQTEQVPVTRRHQVCETEYKNSTFKTVIGYNVLYEYQGQQYQSFVNSKPRNTYVPLDDLSQNG